MKPFAAVYCRLSNQGEQEESIARQKILCTKVAQERGYMPLYYIEPPGARSGYFEKKRPEWMRLKRDLESRSDIGAVIVADFARASRDRIKALEFVDYLHTRGIEFVSLKEDFDLSTAAGRAMLGVLAVFNQLYRDDISERKKRQYAALEQYEREQLELQIQRERNYTKRIAELETALFQAQSLLRSTQSNWNEQAYFDADAVIANALGK